LCYDIGQQVSNLPGEEMAEGVDAAEILILNDYELGVLCKKTGRSAVAIKAAVPLVITTLGKEGSIIEGKNVREPIRIGIVPPRQMADPTGAGDAFRSGLLHGYARHWPIKASAQLGAVCATYAIESIGTQNHTFTRKEAMKRYEQTFKERIGSYHG
jgi:adenosine kinase